MGKLKSILGEDVKVGWLGRGLSNLAEKVSIPIGVVMISKIGKLSNVKKKTFRSSTSKYFISNFWP